MSGNERMVLLWFVALFLAALGVLLLLRGQGFFPEDSIGSSYLAGVMLRSLHNLFQLILGAGLVTVILHFFSTIVFLPRDEATDGYNKMSSWLQVLFTSCGFLGTVIGVSLAVAGLPEAMSENNPTLLIEGLSTAFDTTFIGLLASMLVMICRQILRLLSVTEISAGAR